MENNCSQDNCPFTQIETCNMEHEECPYYTKNDDTDNETITQKIKPFIISRYML